MISKTTSLVAVLEDSVFLHDLKDRHEFGHQRYRAAVERLSQYLGRSPVVSDLSDCAIHSWKEHLLQQEIERREASRTIESLRSLWRWLADQLSLACSVNRRGCSPWNRMSDSAFDDCLSAAAGMKAPSLIGVLPCNYWRALLLVARRMGLRYRAIIGIEFKNINWDQAALTVPAAHSKCRQERIEPVPVEVLEALSQVRTDRQLVFEWSSSWASFHGAFARLQRLAGIPADRTLYFHSLRHSCFAEMFSECRRQV
jgi:integrase